VPDRDLIGELPVEPEPPWGCGWFDSSLDLRRGLAVTEVLGVDFNRPLEQAPGQWRPTQPG
jgi:hypothetical protein